MPKLKTRRGAKKRVKITASGRIKHKQKGLRHILTKKNHKRKRQLRPLTVLHPTGEKAIKEMIH